MASEDTAGAEDEPELDQTPEFDREWQETEKMEQHGLETDDAASGVNEVAPEPSETTNDSVEDQQSVALGSFPEIDNDDVAPMLPVFERPAWNEMGQGQLGKGLRRADANGLEVIDALAGRCSPFGFDTEAARKELSRQLDQDWGDSLRTRKTASEAGANRILELLERCGSGSLASTFELATVYPAAELALEAAVAAVRMRSSDERYRIIAIARSDHGRTGVGRTASGLPELRRGYGPLMAGFDHVEAGDLDGLASRISELTGAVLLSPIELHTAAQSLDGEFIRSVRELCDQHDLLLGIDETQLGFGATSTGWMTPTLADVPIDFAILAGGLFGGLPGGLLLASERAATSVPHDFPESPLGVCVVESLLSQWANQLPSIDVDQETHDRATAIAQTIAGFEFVRDIHPAGGSIGIETDLESNQLIKICDHFGVYVEPAGETAIRMMLPPVIDAGDFATLRDRLSQIFEAAEKYQPVPM